MKSANGIGHQQDFVEISGLGVDVRISMTEILSWESERITQFFDGIEQAIHAISVDDESKIQADA